MTTIRIALANLRQPRSLDEAVNLATAATAEAGKRRALVVCFPKCFVPGYRWPGDTTSPPAMTLLSEAVAAVADAASAARVTVVLGAERVTDEGSQISACVLDPDGQIIGCQLDPSEEDVYPVRGPDRSVFTAGLLTFGVVICHEVWRYPETVRWAVRRGAQVVFHPHAHVAEPGSYRPTTFADPANTF